MSFPTNQCHVGKNQVQLPDLAAYISKAAKRFGMMDLVPELSPISEIQSEANLELN